MTVTRDGDHLLTGRIGMPQVAEHPYTEHDFFLTASAEQNTFVADRSGTVDHVIHYKSDLATTLERITPARASQLKADDEQRVAEELKPHVPVPIDPTILDRDVGYYALAPTELRVCAARSRRRSSVGRTRGVGLSDWRYGDFTKDSRSLG